jgi:hypothetical protein
MSEALDTVPEEEGAVMTIAMTRTRLPTASDVSWRRLDGGLWVARRDGRHLGSVQPGRRWRATDAEGEPIGGFASFREAQAAVMDPASYPAPTRAGSSAWLAVGSLGAAAAVSAAGWLWTSLFL